MYAAEFAEPAGLAKFAEPAGFAEFAESAEFAEPAALAKLVAQSALANFADPDIRQDVDLQTSRVQEFANGKRPLPKGVAFQDGVISIYLKDFAQTLPFDDCTPLVNKFSDIMKRGLIAMANGKVVPTTFLRENLGWSACFLNGSLIIDARILLNPDSVRNNPEALNLLAFLLTSGIFFPIREEEMSAAKIFLGAAKRGNICALYNIRGEELSAAKIFLRAAKQGHICALYNYGYCSHRGIGVKQNSEEAVKIYRTIVENERALARFRGVLALAQYRYGECLYSGDGVEKNQQEAAKYYRLSVKRGNAMAQCCYGHCLLCGIGVPRNVNKAAKYYERSADQGYYAAQSNYGIFLENGIGVDKNPQDAASYYKLAADQGHGGGQFSYGECLERGFGVEKNLAEAAKYYKLAADQGYG
jgi:TPR repeat protein